MTRTRRPFAALLAVVALVFAQMAVSAHACVLHGEPRMAEAVVQHESCHEAAGAGEAPVNGNVCVEHCLYGHASFDNSPSTPAAVDSGGPVLRIEPPVAASPADARQAWRFAPAAAPPPPAILFGVLRI